MGIGDRVHRGQLLNQPRHSLDQYLYAPVSGHMVEDIRILISGRIPYYSQALVLKNDGMNEPPTTHTIKEPQDYSNEEIIQSIRRANIQGMGGGGFPTLRKFQAAQVDSLIINAAECEPYITADHSLLNIRSDEVAYAIALVHQLFNLKQIIFGIENNMTSPIEQIEKSLAQYAPPHTRMHCLEPVYPIGSEKQLIQRTLKKEIPSGKRPLDLGILCLNVATLRAIYRAVVFREPLLERIVTLTGPGIKKPTNYWVILGTPLYALLQEAGAAENVQSRLGGNMMGYRIHDDNLPVGASTNCILVFSDHQNKPSQPHLECIRCGLCEEVCPVYLLPQELYRFIKANGMVETREQGVFDCIECGACDFVCPSKIPLSHYFVYAKEHIKEEQQHQKRAAMARLRFSSHKERIAKQTEERERQRKERLARMQPSSIANSAQEQQEKKNQLVMLEMQINKTRQTIEKWERIGGKDKEEKLKPLYKGLKELTAARDSLKNP